MMPVHPQPAPLDFDKRVKNRGEKFLKKTPNPTTKQWANHDYWCEALPDMRHAYKGICAYSAQWISDNGSDSIDHFIPKTSRPDLAYEWNNYRYTALKFNARKGTRTILDPFILKPDWFILEFPSLLVKPNAALLPEDREKVQHTIDVLKLNDDEGCIEARLNWLHHFCASEFPFDHLKTMMPFVAYELQRQNIIDKIAIIMSFEVKS